jgi:hypothetical protein
MRENREISYPTRMDGKDEGCKRTESPWSRVPRGGKSGEGETRHRGSPQSGLVRAVKVADPKTAMNGDEKSYGPMVPTKSPNETG